jgi:membrane fusion protein (multidrug efflux system)
MRSESGKRKFKAYIPLTIVVIAVLAGAIYWYRDYSRYITTDDAHVDADNVGIESKISGRIVGIYAEEGDSVKKGMLLVELDSSDLLAQKKQVQAQQLQARANVTQAELKYSSDQAGIRILEINLERAKEDFARAKTQSEGGVITAEQFDHARKALETATAQLEEARAQLMVSKSAISSANATAEAANAQLNLIQTQLKNTRLYAPEGGMITKRWLEPGAVVQPGQSVLTLTRTDDIWIVAYPEETKISMVSIGQNVRFTIDAFPGVKFRGKVFLTGSSTASVFSLIPANNASGNFTKVTQRVPVRISIDGADRDISSYKILSGMSAVVRIIKE